MLRQVDHVCGAQSYFLFDDLALLLNSPSANILLVQ